MIFQYFLKVLKNQNIREFSFIDLLVQAGIVLGWICLIWDYLALSGVLLLIWQTISNYVWLKQSMSQNKLRRIMLGVQLMYVVIILMVLGIIAIRSEIIGYMVMAMLIVAPLLLFTYFLLTLLLTLKSLLHEK